jgi:hypothetical protein
MFAPIIAQEYTYLNCICLQSASGLSIVPFQANDVLCLKYVYIEILFLDIMHRPVFI